MFSDIEGFTSLIERLGDRAAMEVLRDHNDLVRGQVAAWGGYEVKAQGDGFMLAFAHPADGVGCAVATQRALATRRWDLRDSGDRRGALRVRMGLHCGEVVRRGDDLLGLNVAIAARVAQHATGGEILVSATVAESVDGDPGVALGDPRRLRFKGIAEEQLVYPVTWAPEG